MIVYINKNTLEVVSQDRFSQLVDDMFYEATQKHSEVCRAELEDVWIRKEVQEAVCDSVSDDKQCVECNSASTADVVEVQHGYWKWKRKIEPQAQYRLYCSVCDKECLSKNNYYVTSNWCPHCGAKMDATAPEED